jgi:hypothetical protein
MPLTMRERMAEHRKNPVCAACHSMIDPLGFALENFDAVGRYRAVDEETYTAVDTSGRLPSGQTFTGLTAFRDELVAHPEAFAKTLTEKLLTYALGRGVEYYDMPAIRQIVRDSAGSDYRVSSLILGIVKSAPFEWRRTPARETVAAAVQQR